MSLRVLGLRRRMRPSFGFCDAFVPSCPFSPSSPSLFINSLPFSLSSAGADPVIPGISDVATGATAAGGGPLAFVLLDFDARQDTSAAMGAK